VISVAVRSRVLDTRKTAAYPE